MKKIKKVKKSKSVKSKKPKEQNFVTFTPISKAAEAALYFGFTPARSIQVKKEDVQKAAALKESWAKNHPGIPWFFSQPFVEERISLLREYVEKDHASLPQPVMIVHETDIIKERGKTTVNLEIMGTDRSIAEALLIKTAVSILKDNGYKDFIIEINSIGDKESM